MAVWWVELGIEPVVVARYVRTVLDKPSLASLATMEAALGLTPASMLRNRLVVEDPAPQKSRASRYAHIKLVEEERHA